MQRHFTELLFPLLFLVAGSLASCPQAGQDCIKNDSIAILPGSGVVAGTDVTFKFETTQKITDRVKLSFNTAKGYCYIKPEEWNTVVNYVLPGDTPDQGNKCVTNLTEVGTALFKYSITFTKITHKESGLVEAEDILFQDGGEAGTVSYHVEVAVAPKTVEIDCDTSELAPPMGCTNNWDKKEAVLKANETYKVRCTATFTRPLPTFSWALDEDIFFATNPINGHESVPMQGNTSYPGDGWVAWQEISYKALAEHDERRLNCVIDHMALNSTQGINGTTTYVILNIPGPPAPAPGVMAPRGSLVAGEAATIFVDFHANPGPSTISWFLADMGGELADNTTSGRYSSRGWTRATASVTRDSRQVSTRDYYAILDIAELQSADSGMIHVLSVKNDQGATNYTFRLEVLDGGLGDGAIAGIVIGVLVAVALVALVAFFLVRRSKAKKSQRAKEERRRRREEERGRGDS